MKARIYLPAVLMAGLAMTACATPAGAEVSVPRALTATAPTSPSAPAAPILNDKAVCKNVAKEMKKDVKFAEQHVITFPGGTAATYGKMAGPYTAEYQRMATALDPTVAQAANPKTKALLQKFVTQLRKPLTAHTKVDDPTTGPDFDYFEKTKCDFEVTVNLK